MTVGMIAGVAGRAGSGAAPGPDAGQGALLADARVRRENNPPDGFLARLTLEPDFKRLVPRPRRDHCRTRLGEVFLNASCAWGPTSGAAGATRSLR